MTVESDQMVSTASTNSIGMLIQWKYARLKSVLEYKYIMNTLAELMVSTASTNSISMLIQWKYARLKSVLEYKYIMNTLAERHIMTFSSFFTSGHCD